jgi:hypothetical protein
MYPGRATSLTTFPTDVWTLDESLARNAASVGLPVKLII